MNYNRLINRGFRKHGLSVRPDAAKEIAAHLQKAEKRAIESSKEYSSNTELEKLIGAIKKQGLNVEFIDGALVKRVIKSMDSKKDEDDEMEDISQDGDVREGKQDEKDTYLPIDAFNTPKHVYDPIRKTFVKEEARKDSFHGNATDKAQYLRERYDIQYQKLMRNELFAPRTVRTGRESDTFQLTQIESLIGRPGSKCIFGMLTQLVEGKYFIEDHNTSVEINLQDAKVTTGLFTDNCMVLSEGELVDNVFFVSTLGFCPNENREVTVTNFPLMDNFGLPFLIKNRDRFRAKMDKAIKGHRRDDLIIILSEVHLDKPRVIDALRRMFKGLEAAQPPLVVLMGNFTSKEMISTPEEILQYRACFQEFADMLAEFPTLIESSKFVLIPGPHDPGYGEILPRPGLPKSMTKALESKLGDSVEFASNPYRVLYCGREMVFFRDDLLHKLRRHCVKPPTDDIETSQHLVRTVLDQNHLCPLPLSKRPIYWKYDHALRMYPLPNVLCLGDVVDQYDWTYEGCHSFNPGCFSTDFSFVVYRPGQQKVEFSRVGAEE